MNASARAVIPAEAIGTTDPYADQRHRSGCECSTCGQTKVCRRCSWWRRWNELRGACWHSGRNGQPVNEHGTCDEFSVRFIRVESR